jgi:hypothetical protein
MLKRGVKAKDWNFCFDLEPALLYRLAERTEGQHVRTLTGSNMHEETAGILCTVFTVCKNIAALAIKNTKHWTGVGVLNGVTNVALQELTLANCAEFRVW